jgi:hypothetical protein
LSVIAIIQVPSLLIAFSNTAGSFVIDADVTASVFAAAVDDDEAADDVDDVDDDVDDAVEPQPTNKVATITDDNNNALIFIEKSPYIVFFGQVYYNIIDKKITWKM